MSASTKLYRLTEKELGALAATAESCMIVGEGLEDEAEEALAAVNAVKTRAKSGIYYQISGAELMSLYETTESCYAMAGDLIQEALKARRAIGTFKKRNGLRIKRTYAREDLPVGDIREKY